MEWVCGSRAHMGASVHVLHTRAHVPTRPSRTIDSWGCEALVYLSAVRHMQIAEGMPDPFEKTRPRLEYVLKGIKRDQAAKGRASRTRLPVTSLFLRKLRQVWAGAEWDNRMIWAACCLCYFGFLRVSEMTATSDTDYSPAAWRT